MPSQHVIEQPTKAAMFLTITINQGAEEAAKDLLTGMSGLVRSVSFRSPGLGVNCVVGIGAKLWDRLYGADTRPIHLHTFTEIRGDKHVAVATGGDLLLHIRAERVDLCFELATIISSKLDGIGTITDEVHGFKFFDERDLLGFVDGTENPEGASAFRAVTIADDDPAYAGGSYVLVQKYLHDMAAWNSLSIEQQEAVIGRTKLDDVELDDDVKPKNSHVALNTLFDADGNQLQILRANMPFGTITDTQFGTFFIGYAADPRITEQMLHDMVIGDPPGNTDRILDFSVAHTGALFFVPSVDFLDDPKPVARNGREEQPLMMVDPLEAL